MTEPLANRHPLDIWAWVAIRFVLAFTLLWAFFDKLFGLGFATPVGQGWLAGNSPTSGYLNFGTSGIFGGLFQGLANNVVVDSLFMLGLLAIGLALLLGIGLKVAAVAGTLFFGLLWLSNFPPVNNPIVDEHIVYIAALWGIMLSRSGRWLGLGNWWTEKRFVRRHPILE
jgi:thiosulfate dehydrogenase [quinone] large subunit